MQILLKRAATWEGLVVGEGELEMASRGFSFGSYLSKRSEGAQAQMQAHVTAHSKSADPVRLAESQAASAMLGGKEGGVVEGGVPLHEAEKGGQQQLGDGRSLPAEETSAQKGVFGEEQAGGAVTQEK